MVLNHALSQSRFFHSLIIEVEGMQASVKFSDGDRCEWTEVRPAERSRACAFKTEIITLMSRATIGRDLHAFFSKTEIPFWMSVLIYFSWESKNALKDDRDDVESIILKLPDSIQLNTRLKILLRVIIRLWYEREGHHNTISKTCAIDDFQYNNFYSHSIFTMIFIRGTIKTTAPWC